MCDPDYDKLRLLERSLAASIHHLGRGCLYFTCQQKSTPCSLCPLQLNIYRDACKEEHHGWDGLSEAIVCSSVPFHRPLTSPLCSANFISTCQNSSQRSGRELAALMRMRMRRTIQSPAAAIATRFNWNEIEHMMLYYRRRLEPLSDLNSWRARRTTRVRLLA
jgi:hypothetical protein